MTTGCTASSHMQDNIAFGLNLASALLSVLGAGFVCYSFFRQRHHVATRRETLNQLIFFLSLADLCGCLGIAISQLILFVDSSGYTYVLQFSACALFTAHTMHRTLVCVQASLSRAASQFASYFDFGSSFSLLLRFSGPLL